MYSSEFIVEEVVFGFMVRLIICFQEEGCLVYIIDKGGFWY